MTGTGHAKCKPAARNEAKKKFLFPPVRSNPFPLAKITQVLQGKKIDSQRVSSSCGEFTKTMPSYFLKQVEQGYCCNETNSAGNCVQTGATILAI